MFFLFGDTVGPPLLVNSKDNLKNEDDPKSDKLYLPLEVYTITNIISQITTKKRPLLALMHIPLSRIFLTVILLFMSSLF